MNATMFPPQQMTKVWVIQTTKGSFILKPVAARHGVILEETFPGSGIMQGLTAFGKFFTVPMEEIVTVFQSWWRLNTTNGGQGHKTWYLDDDAMSELVDAADRDDQWDKDTGELKNVEGKQILPKDARLLRRDRYRRH